MQKILIVKVSSLGDVVHTMPVIADIRRQYPAAQIDWLVEEGFADLVRLVAGVRCVIPFSLRRWRKRLCSPATWSEIRQLRQRLASEAYDQVIDCQGLIKTAWAAHWTRATGARVSGLGNRTEGSSYEWPVRFFYDQRVAIEPHTHVLERSRQLVAAALGDSAVLSGEIDFGLDTQAAETALMKTGFKLPSSYVVLVHATSRADKQWPQERWLELGQILLRAGISLVLPWGQATERAVSEKISGWLNARLTSVGRAGAAAYVPPALTLPAVTGLLLGAAATVGVDTGLVHIAAALKRPTIELYNFDTAWRTGGYWAPDIINLGGAQQPARLADVRRALVDFGVL
ncbi:lipopolysaccharide heptosyltransferase I [Mycoavidus sp. HKI]|uniref:lipopolysaccharide heptosyltransferase I n=1 Tax=Mycoavidus sp. HKI TaxID=2840467 RepID=UPI001CBADD8F|nr:lipopolysaccharide heptosyltransferase I [Mycoavidus sp. HKI]UAW63706.1 lipopolysaccharide heptosyltransferase I [Mycoavidus sp. HKI]